MATTGSGAQQTFADGVPVIVMTRKRLLSSRLDLCQISRDVSPDSTQHTVTPFCKLFSTQGLGSTVHLIWSSFQSPRATAWLSHIKAHVLPLLQTQTQSGVAIVRRRGCCFVFHSEHPLQNPQESFSRHLATKNQASLHF